MAVSLHMDLCILDPLALCGHSDTTRLSVLGQRREALCMCPVVPAFSQARLGLPENKGIPRLDHWGEAILGRVTQRASKRVIFWILQANNFPIIFYQCVSSSPDITGIQVELWLTKRGATLGGPVLFEKLHAQKYTCPRQASCNGPRMSSWRAGVWALACGTYLSRTVYSYSPRSPKVNPSAGGMTAVCRGRRHDGTPSPA